MTSFVRFAFIFVLLVVPNFADDATTQISNAQKIKEVIKGGWNDVKSRILSQYDTIDHFLAMRKEEELPKKINDTVEIFTVLSKYSDQLVANAIVDNETREELKNDTDNLGSWLEEAKGFQQNVSKTTGDELEALKNEWNAKMQRHWNDGLDRIIRLSGNVIIDDDQQNKRESGGGSSHGSSHGSSLGSGHGNGHGSGLGSGLFANVLMVYVTISCLVYNFLV